MKKRRMTAILVAGALMFGGCGRAADTAEVQKEVPTAESEQEESVQEEEPEEIAEGETEPEETEMEPEEEMPVYEEDKNIYGNTIGNLNNEGTFIYNEEDGCLYFQNIYNKHMVKTEPETGNTVSLTNVPMLLLNLYDGKMYGVETTDEQTYGKIYVYDLQADTLEVIREEPASYLQCCPAN